MKRKYGTHTIFKNDDIRKYLSHEQMCQLLKISSVISSGRIRDGKKAGNTYLICNTDEPYADAVMDAICKGEDEKVEQNPRNKQPGE